MKSRKMAQACIAGVLVLSAGATYGQTAYPTRPVRVVVPSSPGGGTDILTRILLPAFSERLGQQVVVDNRPGAGSIIGNDVVAKAAPDGYTLLMGISTLAILPSMHKTLPYNAIRDLAPITVTVSAPNVLVVHPSLPVKTVKAFIDFARKRPGELNYASAGQGTNPHLCMALFLNMTGLKLVHIPYKGSGPALVDLLAGQTVTMMATMLSGLPHIRNGRLRALGITGPHRVKVLPGIPTVAETVPGYEAGQWYGLLAPAKTPKPVLDKIYKAMAAALKSSAIVERLERDGAAPGGMPPDEFGRYLKSETEKWAKVVHAAGLHPQ